MSHKLCPIWVSPSRMLENNPVHSRILTRVKSELNLKIMDRVVLTSSNSIPCSIVYLSHGHMIPFQPMKPIWFINYIIIHNLTVSRPSIWLLVRRLQIQFISWPSVRHLSSDGTFGSLCSIPWMFAEQCVNKWLICCCPRDYVPPLWRIPLLEFTEVVLSSKWQNCDVLFDLFQPCDFTIICQD